MTFSEFVQMLYIRIGGDEKKSDFIYNLTTQIMRDSLTGQKHPLYETQEDTIERFFSGARPLSKKIARVILKNIDKKRFKNYLSEISRDVLDLIDVDLINHGIKDAGSDTTTICTNLFVSVLNDCAKGAKETLINSVLHK